MAKIARLLKLWRCYNMVGINKQIYKVCPVINSKNVRKLNKIQVNTAILDEFERCYGWLGRQMAEKLLLSYFPHISNVLNPI